jgi:putative transposase
MRKSRFTELQILAILGEGEAGLPVAEVCRKHGISTASYYQWKSKYAGMTHELKKVKELEAENARLKRMYAELALENASRRTCCRENCEADRQASRGADHGRRPPPVARTSLQGRGAPAVGAVQAHKGSGVGFADIVSTSKARETLIKSSSS